MIQHTVGLSPRTGWLKQKQKNHIIYLVGAYSQGYKIRGTSVAAAETTRILTDSSVIIQEHYFIWQLPSLLHSDRLTCKQAWHHSLLFQCAVSWSPCIFVTKVWQLL
jgi:hypothetical protein